MKNFKLFSLSKLDRCVQFKRARMHRTTERIHTSRLVLVSSKVAAGSSEPPRNFILRRKCGLLQCTVGLWLFSLVSGCAINRVALQTTIDNHPIRIEVELCPSLNHSHKQTKTLWNSTVSLACLWEAPQQMRVLQLLMRNWQRKSSASHCYTCCECLKHSTLNCQRSLLQVAYWIAERNLLGSNN